MTSAPRAAWLALFGLTLVWGTAFLLVSKAVETLPPVIVAFGRIGFAAAAVIPFALLTGRRFPKDRGRWIAAFWTGTLSLALPFTLLSTAQQSVPSGVAGVYMAVIPLLIMPLAHFFASEPMTTRRVIGVSVGFVGVLCLIGPESLRQLGGETMRGQALCIAASLSYAVGSIMIRRAPKTDSLIAAASALLIGVAVLSPFALIHWPQTAPSRETALTVLWLGVAATGIAMVLRIFVISTAGPGFMSMSGYITPGVALLAGATFANETVEGLDLIGLALILGGLLWAQRGARIHRTTTPRA